MRRLRNVFARRGFRRSHNTHFNVTSYTVPQVEIHVRLIRIGFLQYIIDLADRYGSPLPTNPRVLDVGAAYGHLLDLFRERGALCAGIEIVGWLRDRLHERGYAAYRAAQEVPPGARFDVITMIDSLYYVQRPGDLLRELRPRLHPDGILVLRVANRTPLFTLMRVVGRTITNDIFGDVKYNFSYRGIRQLLTDCGYQIDSVILNEKGMKIATGTRWLYYKLSLLASHLTGQTLTPGIILICRPGDVPKS
jgi:SAM-dependent methyltransferase